MNMDSYHYRDGLEESKVEDPNAGLEDPSQSGSFVGNITPAVPKARRATRATNPTDTSQSNGHNKSLAQDDTSSPHPRTQQLTLREQEQVIDATRKENFSLKLKIYFLEERMAKMAPDQVDLALKENVETKVELSSLKDELRRHKKLLLEAERAIETLKTEGGGRSIVELEREIERMKDDWEMERLGWKERLEDKAASGQPNDGAREDFEDELNHYRDQLSSTMLELERVQREKDDYIQELNACDEEVESWREQYKELRQQKEERDREVEEWKVHYEDVVQQKEDVENALESQQAQLDKAQNDLAEMENYVNEDQDKVEELLRLLDQRNADIAAKEDEINTLNAEQAEFIAQSQSIQRTQKEDDKNRAVQRDSELEDYEDKLNERNGLLVQISSFLENATKAKGSPRKRTNSDSLADFPVFSEALLSRLKELSRLISRFENRAAEIETKFSKQLESMKSTHDARLRQLDRLEGSIKNATESQRQWRNRVVMKQNELDAVRSTNDELLQQISSLKSRATNSGVEPGSTSKMSALRAKASATERRLIATQKQLEDAQEKLKEAQEKVSSAEGKWVARLRELEARLRAAEEKVKRERQGAKERVNDLTENVRMLEGQVADAEKRNKQLDEVVQKKQQG